MVEPCPFRFCFSIVFFRQMLLSFLCLVLVFLLCFVPVTVNATILSIFCQRFLYLKVGTVVILFRDILLLYFLLRISVTSNKS